MVKLIGNSDKGQIKIMKNTFDRQYWEHINALLHKYGVAPLTDRTGFY